MAIVACPDCSKDISDAAPSCPNCGRPNASGSGNQGRDFNAPVVRPVGLLLGLGILLLPIIFAWFTLGRGRTSKARVLSFGYLILSIALFSLQGEHEAKKTDSTSSYSAAQTTAPSETATPVAIGQLLGDYRNNEVAADNRYKGKLVKLSGLVGDIKKDITNSLYVTLGTGSQFEIPMVQAFFDDGMNQQLGQLKKGQKLTISCRVKGLMMNVLLEDCEIN